jgi:MYXO-CTERM domain-containing protein
MRLRSSLLAAFSGLALVATPASAGLTTSAAGRWSYLTFEGRPVLFVAFPTVASAAAFGVTHKALGQDDSCWRGSTCAVILANAPHVERWTVDEERRVRYVPVGGAQVTIPGGTTPEPVSMSVVATGLAGIGLFGALRRRKSSE